MDEPPIRDLQHLALASADFPYRPAKPGILLARGTTPMPNALFDVVMPTLSDTQLRVLLVVARSTLGWRAGDGRKERDWLSHRQLQTRTGRAGAAVSGAIDVLVKRGLLEVLDRSGEARSTTSARRAARGPLFYGLGEVATSAGFSLESAVPPDRKWRDAPASPSLEAERSMVETANLKSDSTSERRLHKAKTTKENGTKENKPREIRFDLSSLGSEVLQVGAEQIASLGDAAQARAETFEAGNEISWADETPQVEPVHNGVEAFIRHFRSAYASARPGQSCPHIEAADRALLASYLAAHGARLLEGWLPAFFASNFGYVRRRSWSLRAYLDSVFVIRAQKEPGTRNIRVRL